MELFQVKFELIKYMKDISHFFIIRKIIKAENFPPLPPKNVFCNSYEKTHDINNFVFFKLVLNVTKIMFLEKWNNFNKLQSIFSFKKIEHGNYSI